MKKAEIKKNIKKGRERGNRRVNSLLAKRYWPAGGYMVPAVYGREQYKSIGGADVFDPSGLVE